ncbi:MAG: HAD family hydrolase [Thermoplasmata archaeon]|jgi:phosphoserine phosphatase
MSLPWRLITVDIDGTLTRGHGWQYIADGLGRRREFDAVMAEFRRGGVSEDRHLERLLALAEGHMVEEVLALVASTPRVSGIRETNDRLHGWGIRVALLSHNPPYVGRWYAETFGFDGFAVMPGAHDAPGPLTAPVGVRADKPGGLRQLTEQFQISPRRVLHVGDGEADAALFPRVGGGVAFNSREAGVRAAADMVVDADDWSAILPVVRRLRPRAER